MLSLTPHVFCHFLCRSNVFDHFFLYSHCGSILWLWLGSILWLWLGSILWLWLGSDVHVHGKFCSLLISQYKMVLSVYVYFFHVSIRVLDGPLREAPTCCMVVRDSLNIVL
ncbi:hypothetical protein T492DRAFT_916538 [Pavlovales sp. CCMP2436]|nr:hypothetical protein T492DRAFT_916538 [Pavlovales sp. CCMP2436]